MDVALDALGKHFEHPAARPRGVHRRRGHGAPPARRVAVFGREVAPDAVAHHGVDQVVPGALNLHTPDALADGLDRVALRPRRMKVTHAMLNGFGFGGVNATLILRRWTSGASEAA